MNNYQRYRVDEGGASSRIPERERGRRMTANYDPTRLDRIEASIELLADRAIAII